MRIPFTNYEIKLSQKLLSQRPALGKLFNGNSIQLMDSGSGSYITNAYQRNPNVYSAISLITRAASKAEFKLFECKMTGAKRKARGRSGLQLKSAEFEHILDHDFYRLIERPNPLQGKAEFIESLIGFKKVTGENFQLLIGPDAGINANVPQEIWVLPPPFVSIKHNDDGTVREYVLKGKGGKKISLAADDVIHNKYWNPSPSDPSRGMSPIQAGRYVVTQNNDAYKAQMKLLQNSGAVGVLSDDSGPQGAGLTQEQTQQLESTYYEKYGGADRFGKIMVTGAAVKWQQIGMSAVDMSIIEGLKVSLRDICNIMGPFSSQLLNDPDNKTFANMKEARKDFIANAVMYELNSIADEWSRALLPMYEKRDGKDYVLKVDETVYPELREDIHKQVETLLKAWWLTPNQRLEEMGRGMSDDPSMDDVWAPTNLLPLTSSEGLKSLYRKHGKS